MSGASLNGATIGVGSASETLEDSSMSGTSMNVGANLSGINILGGFTIAFQFTIMTGANLKNATIAGDGAFEFADLTGANLSGATVTGADDFKNATFSNTTCPDGTNSDNDGGTCVGHGVP